MRPGPLLDPKRIWGNDWTFTSMGGCVDADVAVIGAGPTGLTIANLLGTFGVSVVLVERSGRGSNVN